MLMTIGIVIKQYDLKKILFSLLFICWITAAYYIFFDGDLRQTLQRTLTPLSVDSNYQFERMYPREAPLKDRLGDVPIKGKLGEFRHCLLSHTTTKGGFNSYPTTRAESKVKDGNYRMRLSENNYLELRVNHNIMNYFTIMNNDDRQISRGIYTQCDLFYLNRGAEGDPEIEGGHYDESAEDNFEKVMKDLSPETEYQFKYKKPEGIPSQGKLNAFSDCLKFYKIKRLVNWAPKKGEYNQYKMWISDHVYLDLTTRGEEAYSLILRDEENKTYSSTYRLNCKLSLL